MLKPFVAKEVTGNATVLGYPKEIWDTTNKILRTNESRMYQDSGPIKAVEWLDDEATGLFQYNQLDIVTSVGQSGGPLRVPSADGKTFYTAGIHVGYNPRNEQNYSTMICKTLFLDYILPEVGRF